MANQSTLIDGKPVLANGSIVISPGRQGSVLINALEVKFEFIHVIGGKFSARTTNSNNLTVITIENAPLMGISLDVTGLIIDGISCVLGIAFEQIGNENPHRVLFYTLYPT